MKSKAMKWVATFVGTIGILLGGGAHSGQTERTVKSFPLDGVNRVILRASEAEGAAIRERPGKTIELSATPVGGAKGYHSSDPNWKETPPGEWGLDFVAERFGTTLVISTRNEVRYIHHYYALRDIAVEVPPGIPVVREKRELTGEGAPNLRQP